ncbi:MAG: aldo/keto reductase [Alphaproteobacteria bacterium]|nr:aldo/keto reductase [Alphaproteobacteria bacterium]MCZ6509651.1 aldo/keto reductase [Alphaproteobacteria bacterium]MCZ6591726.1 aldo/keto reductase [Alphaproteobacteria bacterium]
MSNSDNYPKRKLGSSAIEMTPVGLGCMSFSGVYGPSDDDAAIELIHYAIDNGIDALDSSDMYGWGHNEELLGRALAGRRDKIVLISKFGQVQNPDGGGNLVDGRPEYVIGACEASLQRLNTDVIDLYFQHRVDPKVPIEDTVGAMAQLIEQGKVRAIGICEGNPETIRRAHAAHPLAAVQSEYSLLYREQAEESLEAMRELGISYMAYAPLGRGLLTNQFLGMDSLPEDDPHARHPRYAGDNFTHNMELATRVAAIAEEKGCTPAQLCIAWLLAQGNDIVSIPGTKRRERLDENMGALDVALSAEDLARISDVVPVGAAAGTRYPAGGMKGVHI